MLKIGLTGGIGSGKTTVAKIFEIIGIPVYYADLEAKQLMERHPVLTSEIRKLFGDEAYVSGRLNRKYISSLVFSNASLLDKLNKLVHPYTIEDGKSWMNKQHSPYAIKEAALIFESGIQGEFDRIIGVSAPNALRILRSMKRNASTYNDVVERMHQQLEEEIKLKLCDDIIVNDEQKMILPQVLALHEKLLSLSK